MNNRTEQLIHLISKVHSMYLGPKNFGVQKALFAEFSVESNRRRFEGCNFLSIWLVKLYYTAQAVFGAPQIFPGVRSACGLQETNPVCRCDHLRSWS